MSFVFASAAHAQTEFIHTVTAKNISCNYKCSVIDNPDLNNDPVAIIFVTPIVTNGMNLNPHPIGAPSLRPTITSFSGYRRLSKNTITVVCKGGKLDE